LSEPGSFHRTQTLRIARRLALARDWLLTPSCTLCGERVSRGQAFCDGCERSLPLLGSGCAVCATRLAPGADSLICGACQQRPPRYVSVHTPFRYAAPIDRLIQGAKYNARFDWLDMMARRLAEHVRARASGVDAIVPVPLHRSRLRSRGYNQALELARPVARSLRLPLRQELERVRPTPPQTALSPDDRRRNVRNAFAAAGDFTGLRVALIDDVMTTGATAQAVARCLRRAGAASVEVWVVART
jgi:ComF family protein